MMPIGAGAIGNLTQYIPYRAENPGDAFNRGQQVGLQRQNQQWYQGQREKEFETQTEQRDRQLGLQEQQFGLQQEQFDWKQKEQKRALKAQAYDELMDAYLTNDPEQIRAAAQKARLAGLDVPGLEEPPGGAPQAKGEAPPPEKTQTPAPVPAPQEKTLKSVTEGAAPRPGEDIGDGWEVVDTPPEAQQEGPAPWLTKEMQDRGEAPTEQPGNAPAPWLTNELESRGDISFRQAEAARYRAQPPAGIPQAIMEMGGLPARVAPSGGGAAPRGRAGAYPRTAELRSEEMGPMELDTRPYRPSEDTGGVRTADLKDSDRTGYEGVEGLQRFENERQGRRYNTATESAPGVPIGGLPGGQPTPQPQGPKGYQIVDRDTGEVIGQLNPEAAMGRAQARVARAMDSLVENQRNGEEQRAAAIAKDTALRLVGVQGYSVRDAIQAGQQRYDKELGRATAKAVARGGKPDVGEGGTSYERGGRSPEQVRTSKTVGDYVHLRIIQKAQQIYSTKELQAASRSASSIAAKMRDTNPVSQRGAIRDVIMMTEGKRATDRDLDFALSGGGNLSRLHMELKGWIDGGAVPQNLREKFGSYANMLSALLKEQQAKAMKYAEEMIYDDPGLEDFGLTPEDKAYWASQAKRGVAGQAIGLSPRGKSQKEEGEKAMRGGMSSADAEADDIMGELDAR